MAMSLPRMARISLSDSFQQVDSAPRVSVWKSSSPPRDLSRRIWNEPHHRQRCHRLARTRFAHYADGLAPVEGETDVVHGLQHLAFGAEFGDEVAYFQQLIFSIRCPIVNVQTYIILWMIRKYGGSSN
jgi:hypothetical protein